MLLVLKCFRCTSNLIQATKSFFSVVENFMQLSRHFSTGKTNLTKKNEWENSRWSKLKLKLKCQRFCWICGWPPSRGYYLPRRISKEQCGTNLSVWLKLQSTQIDAFYETYGGEFETKQQRRYLFNFLQWNNSIFYSFIKQMILPNYARILLENI